ncbi:hypothetical protein AB0H88_32950 [Nonomuraea sp. NPDC050680]|uniref:hypothetical protein n=1 Tax=Nonomuraea sp. NPDC050680 TaxID=3154630 RepID=UPI0033E4E5A8
MTEWTWEHGELVDAMRTGGATEEEIREMVIGSRVDEAMPDDGEWRLYRLK